MGGGTGFDWAAAIRARALEAGFDLAPAAVAALAGHAALVLADEDRLHLTAIRDPAEFVERHLGESWEGAAMLDAGLTGTIVDLGSGNGYPGLPLAAALPLAETWLIESSERKGRFLDRVVRRLPDIRARVLVRHVQRAEDLADLAPVDILATRAMGAWEKIVPRLVPALAADGAVLCWAGAGAESIFRRTAWRRLEVADSREPAGLDRARIWLLNKRK